MRLLRNEVDKRLNIQLDKSISFDNVKGVMRYGERNDYPQLIEQIVNSSVTARSIANIYSKFLMGSGFENPDLNGIVVGKELNGKDITLKSLLRKVCDSVAMFNGFYILTNINRAGQVTDANLMPFKFCRFPNIDDNNYASSILVHKNWERDINNKNTKGQIFDKKDIKRFNVFNLNPAVYKALIGENMDDFNGMIYFNFIDKSYIYPLSPFDSVYLDCDTEAQIAIYKNNEIRNGLLPKTLLRIAAPSSDEEREALRTEIAKWIGADGSNIITFEDEIDPLTGEIKNSGAFKTDVIPSNINDTLFQTWEESIANNIRKSNRALPSVLIDYDESKLGSTSGEGIVQATNFYNAMTQDTRDEISASLKEIFKHSNNSVLANNDNWAINPLSLYTKEAGIDSADQERIKAQATLKGSVGGVQALLQIQQSVSSGITDRSAGIAIIEQIYGIDKLNAEAMLGTPKLEIINPINPIP